MPDQPDPETAQRVFAAAADVLRGHGVIPDNPSNEATRPVPEPSDGGNASERDSQGVETCASCGAYGYGNAFCRTCHAQWVKAWGHRCDCFDAEPHGVPSAMKDTEPDPQPVPEGFAEKLSSITSREPADPETASERPTRPGETGRASDPRHDPIGTVRIGRDGRAVVKVSMGDETGKGQHVWVHVTQELEQRWFHHNEVAGLASGRPDAGRETAYPHEWPAGYASLAAYEQQIGEARVANQRASSWWEAAKEFARDARRARKAIDRQVLDVANAMARNAEFRARADAAEAKLAVRTEHFEGELSAALAQLKQVSADLRAVQSQRDDAQRAGLRIAEQRDEAVEMVKTCTGHPDRANPAVPSHPELIQQANAERDEARAKLDEIRVAVQSWFALAPAEEILVRIRAIVDREPGGEECGNVSDDGSEVCALPDGHSGDHEDPSTGAHWPEPAPVVEHQPTQDSETEWGCRDRHGQVHSVGVETEAHARAMRSMTPVRREVGPWIEVTS